MSEFKEGDRIRHASDGKGVFIEDDPSDPDAVVVMFDVLPGKRHSVLRALVEKV